MSLKINNKFKNILVLCYFILATTKYDIKPKLIPINTNFQHIYKVTLY
jgi:hypothetical protein